MRFVRSFHGLALFVMYASLADTDDTCVSCWRVGVLDAVFVGCAVPLPIPPHPPHTNASSEAQAWLAVGRLGTPKCPSIAPRLGS